MIPATPTMTVREIPLRAARTLASATPRFNLVAFHWRGAGGVRYRVRFTDGWSPWRTADADTVSIQRGWHLGNLDWVGVATGLETRVVGRVTRLRSYTIWSPPERLLARRLEIANAPPIIPRLSWGADESIRRHGPVYAPKLVVAFVHHTAGSNDYTRAESAAIVRGIEIYHVEGNGWWDIGYNFLVDKYGQVFEGRYGGVDRNVVGAHTMGFNTGSVGVAVLGDYGSNRISPAAARSLEQLLAWRLDVAHLDPLSTLTYRSGGNPRFPAGTPVRLRAVSGHRDAYFTDCPGNTLYAQLPAIAKAASAFGGPKIYAPLAAKIDETHTRFTARLSVAQPWTVTIGYTLTASATVAASLVDSAGQVVASLPTVQEPAGSWTFSYVPPPGTADGAYTIALTATATATATAGTRAVTASAPVVVDDILSGLAVTATNATFTLTRPAQLVTAQVALGAQVVATPAVLAAGGPQVIGWQLPDGAYTLTLTVTDDVGTFSRTTPFVVDTTPPQVTVLSYVNLRFGVNEAATLTLVVGVNRYTRTVTQPGTTQFWLKVKPSAYTLLATDPSGNTTTIAYRR